MPKAEEVRKTKSLPRKKLNRVDVPMVIIILILIAFGIVMVLSASAPKSLSENGNSYNYVIRQAGVAAGGLVLMWLVSRFDYHKFKKWYIPIYFFSVLILFLVYVPGIGLSVNGARRWAAIGPIQFQPSEITKIGLIIAIAGYFTDERRTKKNFWTEILLPTIMGAIPAIIVLKLQNHMSAGIIMMLITWIIVFISGVKKSHVWASVGIVGGLLGILGITGGINKILGDSFRGERLQAWQDPLNSTLDSAYQTKQSLYAIGSGGLFGVGLGQSTQKYTYLPEAHNDFIFAIIAEEMGFFGCALVIILYAFFAFRGILISVRAQDLFGKLIATGIISQIMIQTIMNIAVCTAVIPNTGVSLPFLSYGGTSLLMLLISMGLVLSVSRNRKVEED
jgi:cell division protein FtsW